MTDANFLWWCQKIKQQSFCSHQSPAGEHYVKSFWLLSALIYLTWRYYKLYSHTTLILNIDTCFVSINRLRPLQIKSVLLWKLFCAISFPFITRFCLQNLKLPLWPFITSFLVFYKYCRQMPWYTAGKDEPMEVALRYQITMKKLWRFIHVF